MCIYPIFRVAKQTTYWTGYNREMRKSHHLLTINDNILHQRQAISTLSSSSWGLLNKM